MHNGGFRTLEEVVQFYVRGADFFHANIDNLDPDVAGIPSLRSDPEGIAALVEFMEHLTDERVRLQSAPFDHPELPLPNGHNIPGDGSAPDSIIVLPPTGIRGGLPLQTFASALENGSSIPIRSQTTTTPQAAATSAAGPAAMTQTSFAPPADSGPSAIALGSVEVAGELPEDDAEQE